MSDRYYRPSSAAPITGIFTMLTVGSLAAAVLAALYSAIAYYNPLIYFTFIAAAIFGGGVGLSIQYGAKVGRVRNSKVVFLISVIIAAVAVYLCWVAYLSLIVNLRAGDEIKNALGLIVYQPLDVKGFIQFLAEHPMWEMRGSAPSAGGLYTIWAIEAVIIGGLAVLVGNGSSRPFCETCQRWTDPEDLQTRISLENAPGFVQAMEEERYSAINEFCGGEINEADCIQLKVHRCPNCEESNYLTAERAMKVTNDKGEEETKSQQIFEHLIVPHEVIEGLSHQPAKSSAALAENKVEAEADSTAEEGDEVSGVS